MVEILTNFLERFTIPQQISSKVLSNRENNIVAVMRSISFDTPINSKISNYIYT